VTTARAAIASTVIRVRRDATTGPARTAATRVTRALRAPTVPSAPRAPSAVTARRTATLAPPPSIRIAPPAATPLRSLRRRTSSSSACRHRPRSPRTSTA
jgi:hypothetical protein